MAAAPSSLGAQFKEELSCSICLELFTRPKVLPCQHIFCQDCLQDLAGRGGTVQCPNCRKQFRLPRQGVAGFPDNHLVSSLCERLSNQLAVSTKTPSNSEGKVSQQPKVEEKEQQAKKRPRCDFHPSEELRVYCKQCLVPVCDDCLDQTHAGHSTISLKKAVEERSAALETSVAEGKKVLQTYHSFLRGLADKEKEATNQKEQTSNNIAQVFNQKVQELTKSKETLLKKVEENHSHVLKNIQRKRVEVLVDVTGLSAACDSAEEATSRRDVNLLVQEHNLTQKIGNLDGRKAPTPLQIQHAVFNPHTEVLTVGRMSNSPNTPMFQSPPYAAPPAPQQFGVHPASQLPKWCATPSFGYTVKCIYKK